ncbi:hypothetical protein CK203_055535 [Vitis vinifera]|uniref:Uncharacterized protein n=1 Tax=Vitis vinifera TaxID=29760 RepID=A0A438GXL0_VITVI|nr:hypothetical protein CK203_055535 [Vitis vinifera]
MMALPPPQHHHDKPKSLPTIKGDRAPDTIKGPHTVKEVKVEGRVHLAAAVAPVTRGFNMGTIATTKMSTPSRSRSLARGDKGYFEWRKTMERRQLESERQMQALLQETTRLREENAKLHIQVSSSGPLHDQRPRGQGANSRPNPESMYPGTTGVIPDMCNELFREQPCPRIMLHKMKAQTLPISHQETT